MSFFGALIVTGAAQLTRAAVNKINTDGESVLNKESIKEQFAELVNTKMTHDKKEWNIDGIYVSEPKLFGRKKGKWTVSADLARKNMLGLPVYEGVEIALIEDKKI